MIGVPFLWLAVFFVVPFLILLRISITDMGSGIVEVCKLDRFFQTVGGYEVIGTCGPWV